MKKLLGVFFSLLFVASCTAGTAILVQEVPKAQAIQTLVGIDSLMGSSCNVGYTRVAPHICMISQAQLATALANNVNVCNALDMHAGYNYPSVPAGFAFITLKPANGSIFFYADSSCTTSFGLVTMSATSFYPIIYPVKIINGNLYYKTDTSLGTSYTVGPSLYYD